MCGRENRPAPRTKSTVTRANRAIFSRSSSHNCMISPDWRILGANVPEMAHVNSACRFYGFRNSETRFNASGMWVSAGFLLRREVANHEQHPPNNSNKLILPIRNDYPANSSHFEILTSLIKYDYPVN